jgi:enoyl-CoA hydratase
MAAGGTRRWFMSWDDYRAMSFELSDDGVLVITIEGRDDMNSLDHHDHLEVARVWRDVNDDPDVRVAVVTGAGDAFCAGGKLEGERAAAGDYGWIVSTYGGARDLVKNLVDCDKPIISAINGPAAGAGLAVALLADISIIAEDVRFTDGHVPIGIAAGDHACLIWPLLCGMTQAKYYLLTGDRIDGREAARIGLVTRAVPRGDVVSDARALAQRLATGPQMALRFTKRSLNNWLRSNWPTFEASLAMEMVNLFGPDFAEGIDAFLEKRRPQWSQPHPQLQSTADDA